MYGRWFFIDFIGFLFFGGVDLVCVVELGWIMLLLGVNLIVGFFLIVIMEYVLVCVSGIFVLVLFCFWVRFFCLCYEKSICILW